MSCGDRAGNSAVIVAVSAATGETVEQGRARFHALKEKAAELGIDDKPPHIREVRGFLERGRLNARHDPAIPEPRRAEIGDKYEQALAELHVHPERLPDAATWAAWQALAARQAKPSLVAGARASSRRAAPPPPPEPPDFTAEQTSALSSLLRDHGVDAVLIGGLAAHLHGAPDSLSKDADLCPAPDPENLRRLATALKTVNARVRREGYPGGLPPELEPPLTGEHLADMTTETYMTDIGPIDVCMRPDGTTGYADLARRQQPKPLGGGAPDIMVADLADIIRSKTAANRGKDRQRLPGLRQYLELLRRRDPTPDP
jgi:hypothetical protein